MTTNIIGSHNFGSLDGSWSLLTRSDPTSAGSLGAGLSAFVNVGNGNLLYQERDAFLPSFGEDFSLIRSYNSRGVIGSADGWSYSTAVTLAFHNDSLAGGGTQRNYSVTYGDRSELHFDFDAASGKWISTDGAGAYEVLEETTSGGADFLVTRADQSQYRFDRQGTLLSITDPNGVTMTFSYQGNRLTQVRDDSGHTISFTYTGGNLTRIAKTSAGSTASVTLMQYTYSGGNLTRVTDRAGHATNYTYSNDGMLIGVTLPSQQVVGGQTQTFAERKLAFTYERINWDDHPHQITDFDRGFTNAITSMTDAMGGVTTFDYGFQFGTTMAPEDRDQAYKETGSRKFLGGTTRVVDALGNKRALSNEAEYVAWRTANGFYATYSAAAPQAQVDAIRNAQSVVYVYDANNQITKVTDPLGFVTTYAYDADGNLASIVDRNGGRTSFAYDARGNQIASTDPAGNVTTFTYTAFNKVATITTALGNALATSDDADVQAKRVELGLPGPLAGLSATQAAQLRALYTTTFEYDAQQNLAKRTDPGGDVTTYTYDASGNLLTSSVAVPAVGPNPAQTQVTTYTYDAWGNAVSIRDGEGQVTTRSFDAFGNLLTSTDPRGGTTTFTYDADNRLLTLRTPEGRVTANAYDAVGNRIAVTDEAGHTVTQVFDLNNLLIATIDPAASGAAAAERRTSFRYDILGNNTAATDAEGRTTTYRYDARRLLVELTTPSVAQADGSTGTYSTTYGYDGEGNVLTLTDPNGRVTTSTYTSTGLTRSITDAIGNITEYSYDANLQQIRVVIGAQLPAGERRVLRYGYDEEDQLVELTDALGKKVTRGLDAVGNVVSVTDENGAQTFFQFDRNNRLVKETLPGVADVIAGTPAVSYTVLHKWDGNGNEIETTDENGAVTKFSFDRDDRRVLVVDPNNVSTVFDYDSRGNTTRIVIGADASYDAATARVTIAAASLAAAQVESYAYDEFNQLVTHTDGVGNALVTSDAAIYQALRQQLGKAAGVAALSTADKAALLAQFSDRFAYDKVGNRVRQTDHLGRVTNYAYDTLDRLLSRTDADGTGQERVTRYRYDGNGNRVRTTDALGRVATYQFDAVNRITQTTDPLGVVTSFEYDHVGNKLSETLAAGTPDERETTYVYDLGDRLLSQTDPEGHRSAYEYDAVGNRLKVTTAAGTAVAQATQYFYDALGREVRVIDPLGFETKTAYDGRGDVLKVMSPNGGVRELKYDAGGRYIETTDAEGRITKIAYDRLGNAVEITTASGRPEAETTRFVYDAEGNLRSVTDAEGNVAGNAYDAVYNLTRAVDGNGNATRYEYDALNRVTKVIDAEGGETSYAYDRVDNQLQVTDALGRVRKFAYDANDRVITETDALDVDTTYAYDRVGNTVRITRAANIAGQARTIAFVYDKDDRLVRETDALLGSTDYAYDANDNVVTVTDAKGNATSYVYDLDNRVRSITDPLGNVTSYVYDGNGNRTQVIDARGGRTTSYYNLNDELVQSVSALGFVTTRSHDGNGNVIAETRHAVAVAVPTDPALPAPAAPANPGDRTTRYGYDKLNRLVTETSPLGNVDRIAYDAVGNRVTTTDANGRVTRYEYDEVNRLVRQIDALGASYVYTHDAVGNVLTETDELGRVTTYTYDLEDRLLTEKNALGDTRSHAYDELGNEIATIDELGRRTEFEYDKNNRVTKKTDALGGETVYEYDAVGNQTAIDDANGHRTSFEYDAGDRLTKQTDALGQVVAYAYDAVGNKTAETDENGHTTRYAYDLDGRQTGVTTPLGNARAYAYDAVGNLLRDTDANGNATSYTYDLDGRVATRTTPLGGVRRYGYDAAGNQTSETDENGHTTNYQYDALNRVTRQTNPLGAGNFRSYAYDAVGNTTAETDENGNTTEFEYDDLDRLTKRTDPLGGERDYTYDKVGNRLSETDERGKTTRFAYDALDRQTRQTNALGDARTFSHDAVGNVLTETDEDGRVTTRTYDADDRLLTQTDNGGHQRKLTYDAAGNIATQTDENGKVTGYAYDADGRLVEQTDPLGGKTSYGYDAGGRKTSEQDPSGGTTAYAYDANDRLVEQTDPLGGKKTYGYDAAGNLASETDANGHAATYTRDANDRVVKVVDGEGYETTLIYDAAGNLLQRKQELDLTDATKLAVTTEKYDDNNRVTDTLTADGRLIHYDYDASGNLTAQTEHDRKYTIPTGTTVPGPDAADPGRKTEFTYDDAGHQVEKTTPEGVKTHYDYDKAGNRIGQTDAEGTAEERDTEVEYDDAGRVTQVTDALGNVTKFVLDSRGNILERQEAFGTAAQRVTKYEYDANNRVVREIDAEGFVTTYAYNAAGDMTSRVREGRTESFEYDAKHQLTAEVNGAGDRTEYRYDGAGNRIEIRYGIRGTSAPLRVLKYEYDENDNLTAEVDGNGVRTVHRYDGAGNRIETIQNAGAAAAAQRSTEFAYDGDNRLVEVTNAEGGVTRYEYDALGNQIRIVGPTGSETRNTFDKNGRVTVNIVGANGPKGGIRTANVYDERGNVVATTVSFGDGTDVRTTRYTYDALDRQTSVTDAEGFTTQFTYDAFGNQTRIRTGLYLLAAGDAGYDAAKAARAHASELQFTYDKLDRLTDSKQITNNTTGAGDTLHSTYDAFGNRLTQTTGFGTAGARTLEFAYDGADRLVRRETPAGGVLTLEYDAAGNQIAKHQLQSGTEGSAGAVWIDQFFEYDGNGWVVAERNVLDATTTVRTEHRFDAFGNEIETVLAAGSPDARTTRFVFNANNDLVQRIEAFGTPEVRATSYLVDDAGLTLRETDALGRQTRFYYDPAGRQIGVLDAGGYYTAFELDAAGNVTRSLVYLQQYAASATPPTPAAGDAPLVTVNTFDRVSNLVRQVGTDGTRVDYAYDSNRKLLKQTSYGSTDAARVARTADTTPREQTFTYDDALRVTRFVNADGSIETYAYDNANNRVSESIQAGGALVEGRVDPTRTTTFEYDADNRLVRQTFDPDGLALVETLVYDKAGNVVSKNDAGGGVTASVYDRLNRVTKVTDPGGNITEYGYDRVGNQTSVKNPRGAVTELKYDDLNQLVEQVLPAVDVYTVAGGLQTGQRLTTKVFYDAVGNVRQQIDEAGGKTTTWYDANDNVIAELDAGNVLRTATFDATGVPLSTTLHMRLLGDAAHDSATAPAAPGGDTRTTTFEYDKAGRVTRTNFPTVAVTTLAGTGSETPSSTESDVALHADNHYDAFGNLVESVDRAGRSSYGYYDTLGRQVAAVDAAGYLVESFYDSQGNLVQQRKYATALNLANVTAGTRPTAPSGSVAVVDRIYDAASRLIEEISPEVQLSGSSARVRTTYTYDDSGKVRSRTLAAGTTEAQTEYYWYDAAGRQVAVVNAGRTLHTYGYDAAGNKTEQKRSYNVVPGTLTLSTATLAQLTASVTADAANDQRTTYVYDALNRLTRQAESVQGSAGDVTIAQTTEYDAVGNTTRRVDGDAYATRIVYDALGQATRTITPDGTTSFVEYNAAGEKVRAWTGVLGANGAQSATDVSARVGSGLEISWTQGGSNVRSYVVYDTDSHPDADLATRFPSAVYADTSSIGTTGAVSTTLDLTPYAAGATLYFRVVTVDAAGSQAWTAERSVVVPARPTTMTTRQSGTDLVVRVTFNGAVTTPRLLYGTTSGVSSSAALTLVSGNTYTVTIPQAQAAFFALQWTAGGTSYTTAAAAFAATGPHTYDAANGEIQWTLPTQLASQQSAPGQLIVVNGVRVDNGFTFGGTVHFTPTLATNGTYTLDAYFGNTVADSHSVTVRNEDRQTYTFADVQNRDGDGNVVSVTRTYTYAHDYRSVAGVTLSAAEAGTVSGAVRVRTRVAGTGSAFTGDTALTRAGNTWSGALALAPDSYDLEFYYTDTSGREVIVEWRRITVAAATLPATVSQTDSSAPFDFAGITPPAQPTVVTATNTYSGRSLVVLGNETGGSIVKTGANVTVTAGRYSGPLSPGSAPFALTLGTTAGTTAAQRGSNGLLAQTYFTEIEYNALGQKIASNEENDGLWRRFGLDANGNKVVTRLYGTQQAEEDGLTPITTYTAYDARDLEVARFGAAYTVDGGATRRAVTRFTYDYAGQRLTQLDPGTTTARSYAYDNAGNRVSETDPLGNQTRYTYDRLGNVVSVTDALSHTRRRVYDGAGRMTQEIDALGKITSYGYDAFDRITTRSDALGNVTRYAYDRRDRLTKITDATSRDTLYRYDNRDNRTSTVDANGQTLAQTFDAMSRVLTTSTSSLVTNAGTSVAQTITYTYDSYGNRASETDAEGRTRYMSYGAAGRLVQLSDEGGRVTTYAYDRYGRQTSETGSNGKSVVRAYNAAGLVTSVVDTGTGTTSPRTDYTYDVAGRRVGETVVHVAEESAAARTIRYTWDAAGRMTRWADSVTGQNLNYAWDAAGNQARVYNDSLSTNHFYAYDANDRVLSVKQGTTDLAVYSYDDAGNRKTYAASGTTMTYGYDAIGRVVSATDGAGKTRATWSYDNQGNVLEYKEFKSDGTTLLRQTTNTYYGNGLTRTSRSVLTEDVGDEKKKDQTTTSDYDKSRRLITQTLVDSTDSANVNTYTYNYTYAADGRELSVAASGANDAAGNSTSTYDANDRLVRLDRGQGDEAERAEFLTFKYDNDNHIVHRFHDDGEDDTTTSPTTRFIYANSNPVGETGTDKTGATVTLLDINGTSGDGQQMRYNLIADISKDYPSASVSQYTVRAGDTLQSVAAAMYGNPSLWFLIADANGLTGSEALKAGQVLEVPTSVQTGRLNSDAHVLYKESDIIGSKLPNLNTPDSGSNTCALIGAIILIIVVAIAAIVLTIVTAGIAAPAAVAALGLTAGSVAAVVTTVAVTAVVGAVIGFAASVATQGILVGFGLQKEFDWKQVAADTVAAFISGAVAGLGQAVQLAKLASTVAKVANVAAQAVLEAAGETARQAIANDGHIDNPWTILVAGAGGAFGAIASRAVRTENQLGRKVAGVLERRIVEVAPAAGKAGKLLGKSQKIIQTGVNAKVLGQFEEGASVIKGKITKLVKTVDDAGNPALKQVERTAFQSKTPKTILKLADTKLVRFGDEVFQVPRISSVYSRSQRVGMKLSGFADTALTAIKSVTSKSSGGPSIATRISSAAKNAVTALKSVPDKVADFVDDAKFLARVVKYSARQAISNAVDSATTTLRSIGRAITELPAAIAKNASEAWGATKTALRTARDGLTGYARSAVQAVRELPAKIKTGAAELAQSIKEAVRGGTVSKGTTTKIVRTFEDGPNGRVAKLTEVLRERVVKKGFATLTKADGVNGLETGTKLVRVGDDVQTWRTVSSQYSLGQRVSRYLAGKPVLNKLAGDEFAVGKTIQKFADTKIVRTGFVRQFNEVTQTFDEVAKYSTVRRLGVDGVDKTTRVIQVISDLRDAAVKALSTAARTAANAVRAVGRGIGAGLNKAYEAAGDASLAVQRFFANDAKINLKLIGTKILDAVKAAIPGGRAGVINLAGGIAFTVGKAALRDYKDDRAPGPISTLIVVGKGTALAALKRPREALNNALLHQELYGLGKDDETNRLRIRGIRSALYGLEKNHGWFPFDWIATGTNVVSRIQSPIDLDYNARYEQQLRAKQMTSGQTAQFETRSVFDFESELDGRIVDRTMPLWQLNNLPPQFGPVA